MARTKRIRNKGKLQTNGTKRKSRTKRVRDKSGRKVGGMRLGGGPDGAQYHSDGFVGKSDKNRDPPSQTQIDSGCMGDLGRVAVDSCLGKFKGCAQAGIPDPV